MVVFLLNIYWSWIILLVCLLPFDKQYYLKSNLKNILILAFFSLLIFFIGFRYQSVDYSNYKIIFNSISFQSINFPQFKNIAENISIEFIFGFFISIVKGLNLSFYSFISIRYSDGLFPVTSRKTFLKYLESENPT